MAKILVVDDSATDRRLIVAALSAHNVLEASSGDDGVQMALQNRPDLVIMDVVMPGKNGFQACRDLRRHEETEKVPVILLSTKNQPTDREWGMRQGADEYLTKPFSDEELLKLVGKYV
jgi:twitching motility two-component system response regulator PilH